MTVSKKVAIKIGDKSKARHLRFDHASLEKLELASGNTLDWHGQRLQAGSAIAMSWIVWAGLIHAEPDLTREEVSGMLALPDYMQYAEAIAEAQRVAFGKPEAAKGNEPAAA